MVVKVTPYHQTFYYLVSTRCKDKDKVRLSQSRLTCLQSPSLTHWCHSQPENLIFLLYSNFSSFIVLGLLGGTAQEEIHLNPVCIKKNIWFRRSRTQSSLDPHVFEF